MNNPGPSIAERASLLAREKGITFRAALQELQSRGVRLRRERRQRQQQTARIIDAHVSRLERQGLF
jgi:hypothetical protein